MSKFETSTALQTSTKTHGRGFNPPRCPVVFSEPHRDASSCNKQSIGSYRASES